MSIDIFNRPGLSQLEYRIGTFGSFSAEMKSRLASADLPELAGLTTRDGSDPAIALLDAWAIVADVLTFYQERIANDGFLRTAIEQRSVFELANLVGFRRRPGVAASVFLAYGLEKDARLTIKKGSRSQSVPGGVGDLPQTYETSQDLVARAEWNNLGPRLTIPQTIGKETRVLYFKGANLGLKPNDPLLFVERSPDVGRTPAADRPFRFVRIHSIEESFEQGRTTVVLDPLPVKSFAPKAVTFEQAAFTTAARLRGDTSGATAEPILRGGDPLSLFDSSGLADVLAEIDPRVPLDQLNAAARADVAGPPDVDVYMFRVHSAPYGHNAPPRPLFGSFTSDRAELAAMNVAPEQSLIGYTEWTFDRPSKLGANFLMMPSPTGSEPGDTITLDSAHETILPDSWVAIVRPLAGKKDLSTTHALLVYRAGQIDAISRAEYGATTRATRIALGKGLKVDVVPNGLRSVEFDHGWLEGEAELGFRLLRETVVYARSERLELAERPFSEPVWRKKPIELDDLYDGLDEGRWLIVEGERADVLQEPADIEDEFLKNEATGEAVKIQTSGVRTAELVRVAAVLPRAIHGPVDMPHSHVTVSPALAHAYKRDTVIIHGNVVLATHGDIRKEVLGSGDATRPYQTLALRQAPITFVPAATASGAASSLELRVNEIRWHEVESLVNAEAGDRVFVAELDGKGGVRVIFGDGKRGSRVPTGTENVTAQYRVGIGAAGNAKAGHVSQLMDRPPGAKEVGNPLPASGGADPDTPDQARDIAPLSVKALDRLVSVSDYRDFARLFAGIAKATASEEWQGMRRKVVVTVAAAGGLPIAGSALHRSLLAAMQQLGDPSRSVEVVDFNRYLLVLGAGVRLLPDYSFESVRPKLLQALLDALSFERRRLGDDLPLAQVLALMHRIEGVHSVDVDVFATIAADDVKTADAVDTKVLELRAGGLPPERLPASPVTSGTLVYASPRVPGTLRLREIP